VRDDLAGDVVLERDQPARLARESPPPELPAVGDAHEIGADRELVSALLDRSREERLHAELAADLPRVDRAALVVGDGAEGEDLQPREMGQAADDVLRDAVAQVLVLGIAPDVREGQHRDRTDPRTRAAEEAIADERQEERGRARAGPELPLRS